MRAELILAAEPLSRCSASFCGMSAHTAGVHTHGRRAQRASAVERTWLQMQFLT